MTKERGKKETKTEKLKEFINPIDPDKVAENPGFLPYAHTIGAAVVKPEDKGKIKGKAIKAMQQQTDRQFQQLFDQMQTLATQAQELKRRVEVSNMIYDSHYGFQPVINETYYLYERKDGDMVLSLVGPKEWGRSFPFASFLASAKLLGDHTWEVLKDGEGDL